MVNVEQPLCNEKILICKNIQLADLRITSTAALISVLGKTSAQ
jgi:hypothetical protein